MLFQINRVTTVTCWTIVFPDQTKLYRSPPPPPRRWKNEQGHIKYGFQPININLPSTQIWIWFLCLFNSGQVGAFKAKSIPRILTEHCAAIPKAVTPQLPGWILLARGCKKMYNTGHNVVLEIQETIPSTP